MEETGIPLATEPFELRHRNPLARRFVVVGEPILLGYPQLSDGARVTYMVIYSHDWAAPGTGQRKGYVYPTVGRLARLRRKSERTLQRHLAELLEATLLTREFRAGKPSVLYIEDPNPEPSAEQEDGHTRPGGDKNVTPSKLSPHKQEETRTAFKQDKSVNGGYASLGKPEGQVDYLVSEILKVCGDEHSRGYYRLVARAVPDARIFAALSEVTHDGPVRNRGAAFVSKVRRFLPSRRAGEEQA